MSDNGGEPERLITTEPGRIAHDPQRIPRGDWVLFSVSGGGGPGADEGQVMIESVTSKERRVLRKGGSSAWYVPTGHLMYVTEGVLFAVPFDVDRLEVTGGPVPIVEGVRRGIGPPGLADFDVSDTGTPVYLPGPARVDLQRNSVALADRAGAVTELLSAGAYGRVRASPDGTRLAIDSDDGREAVVWIYDLGGASAMRRLTFGGRSQFPVWSPDGQRIAFQSDREGDLAIFAQRVDGTGVVERLTKPEPGQVHTPESWSPDGKHMSFSVSEGLQSSLWILSIDGRTTTRFGDVHSIEPIGSVFSPDGRWIAYHSRVGTEAPGTDDGVFVEPFPATGERHQAPKVGFDFQPVWSPKGNELFYVPTTASGLLAAVQVVTPSSGVTFGNPERLPFTLTAGRLSASTRSFDVLADGRFVGLYLGSGSEMSEAPSPEIRVVVNWFVELKRLVPTK